MVDGARHRLPVPALEPLSPRLRSQRHARWTGRVLDFLQDQAAARGRPGARLRMAMVAPPRVPFSLMASIVLRDVEKYFGDNYIVRKLNLEIRHREFLVLLGPSGCGKTTTLRAIAGLEDIDSGEILIDGQPVQSRQAADRDIAFVFQLFALYPHLTAYGNIAFPLRATNEKRDVVDRRVREVAKALRIEGLLG